MSAVANTVHPLLFKKFEIYTPHQCSLCEIQLKDNQAVLEHAKNIDGFAQKHFFCLQCFVISWIMALETCPTCGDRITSINADEDVEISEEKRAEFCCLMEPEKDVLSIKESLTIIISELFQKNIESNAISDEDLRNLKENVKTKEDFLQQGAALFPDWQLTEKADSN